MILVLYIEMDMVKRAMVAVARRKRWPWISAIVDVNTPGESVRSDS